MGYFPWTWSPTNLDVKRKTFYPSTAFFCPSALLIPSLSSFRGLFELLVLYHCVRLFRGRHCVCGSWPRRQVMEWSSF